MDDDSNNTNHHSSHIATDTNRMANNNFRILSKHKIRDDSKSADSSSKNTDSTMKLQPERSVFPALPMWRYYTTNSRIRNPFVLDHKTRCLRRNNTSDYFPFSDSCSSRNCRLVRPCLSLCNRQIVPIVRLASKIFEYY